MVTRKKSPAASVAENVTTLDNTPRPASMSVSPEELKERFGPQKIPLAGDFASLIEMADIGCRAVGQASNQDGTPGNGLALNAGRLAVAAKPNNGIVIDSAGIGVVGNATKGIIIESAGIGVVGNAAKGIIVESAGIGVVGNAAKGIVIESSGIGVVGNAAKGIIVESAGIGINVGLGVELQSSAIKAKANAAKGIVVESAGIGVVGNTAKGIVVESAGVGIADDAWIRIFAQMHKSTLVAVTQHFVAFATIDTLYSGTIIYIHPRGAAMPFISDSNPGYITLSILDGRRRIETYSGLPSWRANPEPNEALVQVIYLAQFRLTTISTINLMARAIGDGVFDNTGTFNAIL